MGGYSVCWLVLRKEPEKRLDSSRRNCCSTVVTSNIPSDVSVAPLGARLTVVQEDWPCDPSSRRGRVAEDGGRAATIVWNESIWCGRAELTPWRPDATCEVSYLEPRAAWVIIGLVVLAC